MSPRGIVARDRDVAHRSSGKESSPVQVEREGENGAIGALRRQWHILPAGRIHDAESVDATALQGDGRAPVIVADIDHQGKLETERSERVRSGNRNRHRGGTIEHQPDGQADRVAGNRASTLRLQTEPVFPRPKRNEGSGETASLDLEALGYRTVAPHGAREWRGDLAPGLQPGPCRQDEGVTSGRHRLALETQVRRVPGRDLERAEKDRKPNRRDRGLPGRSRVPQCGGGAANGPGGGKGCHAGQQAYGTAELEDPEWTSQGIHSRVTSGLDFFGMGPVGQV